MKRRLSLREQRTALSVGLLAVVILAVYVLSIVGPLMRGADELRRRVRSAREEFKRLEVATANEALLREQQQQLQETVTSLRELLPYEAELPRVIERLSELASQTQVKIQSIFPQRPVEGASGSPAGASSEPAVYEDVIIQIDAVAGYHQLGAFLSFVELDDKPMEVSSLRITGEPDLSRRHRIKLLLRSYFATGEAGSV